MKAPVFVIPGIGSSGPNHWQSLWEATDPSLTRLELADWDHPECSTMVAAIEEQTSVLAVPFVVVAHSLGCLAFAHWASKCRPQIVGALLVALPDPTGPKFPSDAMGFSKVPLKTMPFKTIVVFSNDDPFSTSDFSMACAQAWGSSCISLGNAGHINAASNLGHWREGLYLLDELRSPNIIVPGEV